MCGEPAARSFHSTATSLFEEAGRWNMHCAYRTRGARWQSRSLPLCSERGRRDHLYPDRQRAGLTAEGRDRRPVGRRLTDAADPGRGDEALGVRHAL